MANICLNCGVIHKRSSLRCAACARHLQRYGVERPEFMWKGGVCHQCGRRKPNLFQTGICRGCHCRNQNNQKSATIHEECGCGMPATTTRVLQMLNADGDAIERTVPFCAECAELV